MDYKPAGRCLVTTVIVQRADYTEDELFAAANAAQSAATWTIGECAHLWTESFARGRTDGDFGAALSEPLTQQRVNERRLVWIRFGSYRLGGNFPALKWSHYREALSWDDAEMCLEWANRNGATKREMRAWRNMRHGVSVLDLEPEETVESLLKPFDGEPETPVARPKKRVTKESRNTATVGRDSRTEESGKSETADVVVRPVLTLDEIARVIRSIDMDNVTKARRLIEIAYELAPELKPQTPTEHKVTDDDFEAFWTQYPRQKGKGNARVAYKKAAKRIGDKQLLAATTAFGADCREGLRTGRIEDVKYIPHPATWLNGERWDDEPDRAIPAVGKTKRQLGSMADWLHKSIGKSSAGDVTEGAGGGGVRVLEESTLPF